MANPHPKPEVQWKPGQSGNPNGRPPKGYSISETIRDMMNEKPAIKQALGAKIFELALKGDVQAIKLIWSYMDGMPQQDITSGGKSMAPVSKEELEADINEQLDERLKEFDLSNADPAVPVSDGTEDNGENISQPVTPPEVL